MWTEVSCCFFVFILIMFRVCIIILCCDCFCFVNYCGICFIKIELLSFNTEVFSQCLMRKWRPYMREHMYLLITWTLSMELLVTLLFTKKVRFTRVCLFCLGVCAYGGLAGSKLECEWEKVLYKFGWYVAAVIACLNLFE